MASGGTACPFRGRHSPDEGFLPIISSIHRKMILSRNSSPIGKIPAVWEFSGWPHEQKEALLRLQDVCRMGHERGNLLTKHKGSALLMIMIPVGVWELVLREACERWSGD